MKIAVECGQRWWRYRSWVPRKYPGRKRHIAEVRSLGVYGFAVGPIMFIKRDKEVQ